MTQQTMFATKKGSVLKKKQKEENLQLAICTYIKLQYPNVIFSCDLASGLRLPIWLGAKHKAMRSSRGLPDLFISEPTFKYSGLYIELKREDVVLIRPKDAKVISKGEKKLRLKGDWYDDHIEEQAIILEKLRQRGYRADFAVGFTEAKKIIDDYLQ
jgi:hypothetical protein